MDGGTFSLWQTLPASNPSALFTRASRYTYAFHSVACDAAGNVEFQTVNIEASTYVIAVGTVIADRPPHRSVRAELPHTVLTLDVDLQTARCSAAARTPSNPRDLATNGAPSEFRRCVRSSSDCPVFSLVSSLPSANSAGSATPPLFAGFPGTMELCDSPATCMSGLWPRAFSDRSASMKKADVTGVSRLP